jgi:hypothetical protein
LASMTGMGPVSVTSIPFNPMSRCQSHVPLQFGCAS